MDETEFKSGLLRLHRLLDPPGVPWAIAAGSAVYLYSRNRQPADLDVMVRPVDLGRAGDAMKVVPSVAAAPWGESEKIEVDGIEVSGRLTVRMAGRTYPYLMDVEMVERMRRVEYGGIEAPILAPEDIIAFKAVLQRGPEQGKHDLEDIGALASSMSLDIPYLLRRLGAMRAEDRAMPVLSGRGWLA